MSGVSEEWWVPEENSGQDMGDFHSDYLHFPKAVGPHTEVRRDFFLKFPNSQLLGRYGNEAICRFGVTL